MHNAIFPYQCFYKDDKYFIISCQQKLCYSGRQKNILLNIHKYYYFIIEEITHLCWQILPGTKKFKKYESIVIYKLWYLEFDSTRI